MSGRKGLGAKIVDVRRIWDEAPHNAFTDLVFFRGAWYCTFREGTGHGARNASEDGKLRVITSPDGAEWTSVALMSGAGDLRDPKLCITADGELMRIGGERMHPGEDADTDAMYSDEHQTFAWLSRDGRHWGEPCRIGDSGFWLWRVTWHDGVAYSIAGSIVGKPERQLRVYRSLDGRVFESCVDSVFREADPLLEGYSVTSENTLLFSDEGTALCLGVLNSRWYRRSLLGRSRAPFVDWEWKNLERGIGGASLVRLSDGSVVAALRYYEGSKRDPCGTSLCWLDVENGRLEEFLKLPSGGDDMGYPGVCWHEDMLWASYYSSHEGKTSIYLARVAFA